MSYGGLVRAYTNKVSNKGSSLSITLPRDAFMSGTVMVIMPFPDRNEVTYVIPDSMDEEINVLEVIKSQFTWSAKKW